MLASLQRTLARPHPGLLSATPLPGSPQGHFAVSSRCFRAGSVRAARFSKEISSCRAPSRREFSGHGAVLGAVATASSAVLAWQISSPPRAAGVSADADREPSVQEARSLSADLWPSRWKEARSLMQIASLDSDRSSIQGKSVERGQIVFEEPTLVEWLHYRFDDYLSTTSYPGFTFMGAATSILLASGAVAFYYLSGVKHGVGEAVWIAWTVISDPGTHTLMSGGRMRVISVIFTIGGLFFFALLIGLVNDEISSYMEKLQGGLSKVLVRDHVLLLGSSSKITSVLTEFGKDFDSKCDTYVVMADQPLDDVVKLDNGARVITRKGDCSDPADILAVSPNTARSVMLLSPECEDHNEADAIVMARAMVLVSLEVHAPIIAEIRDKDNITALRKMLKANTELAEYSSQANTELAEYSSQVVPVAGDDVVGCMMVLGAFEPGISEVVHHLLDYAEGDEMEVYVQPIDVFPQLEGKTYGEAIFMFDGAVVLGVVSERARGRRGCPGPWGKTVGPMILNPPDDFVFQKGDKICSVVKNLDSFIFRETPASSRRLAVASSSRRHQLPVKNILLCNWRRDIEDVFRELDKRVGKGSVVTVVSHYSVEERHEMLERGGGLARLKNIDIKHVKGQTVKQSTLQQIVQDQVFDAILVFSDTVDEDHSKSGDARAAVCSLLLRSLMHEDEEVRGKRAFLQRTRKGGRREPYHDLVITEIKDRKSLQLLRVSGVSHFVIANELSSMMMVHMACRPEIRHFWIDNIFSDQGDDMKIVRVDEYVDCSDPARAQSLNFWDLLATCRVNSATPFGFAKSSAPGEWRYNPADKITSLGLQADDLLVVLAPAHADE